MRNPLAFLTMRKVCFRVLGCLPPLLLEDRDFEGSGGNLFRVEGRISEHCNKGKLRACYDDRSGSYSPV